MKPMVTIDEAATLLACSARHVRRLCEDGRLPGARRVGKGWEIPRSADSRLAGVKSPEQLSAQVDLTDVPAHKRDEAIRRRGLIESCERYCAAAVRNGTGRVEALERFCFENQIPRQTMYTWMAAWRSRGLGGLIDKRGGQSFGEIISPEAWSEFLSMYLTEQRLSIKTCWNNILYLAKREKKNWTVPSLRTLQRYVSDKVPEPVLVLHREGMAAYEAKCCPHTIIDQDSVEPGSVWVGDHHQFDCWVRHRGTWVRPWITAWEDYRSRTMVGWHVSASPNSTTILQAMRRGIERYGAPQSVKIDNGKDYDSRLFTGQTKQQRKGRILSDEDQTTIAGIYAMMGITVSFAIPYHPQSKKIERWFDTLDCQFTKTVATYCGKDTHRRPEDLADYLKTDKAMAEAFTLETFAAAVERYIDIYNRSAHSGDGMDGDCPLEVLRQRTSIRQVDRDTLDLLMQVWSGELTVGKNGIKLMGMWYGQYNAELMRYFGKPVRAAYNPDDLRTVAVYDANSFRLITVAEQAKLVQYGKVGEEAVREAMANKSRAVRIVKQARPAGRVAAMSLTDLMLEARAETAVPVAAEEAKNVRPVRTPLDGQAGHHRRAEQTRLLKRAVGDGVGSPLTFVDEQVQTQTTELTFIEPEETKPVLRIFGDEQI